jgi:hypothetical protein
MFSLFRYKKNGLPYGVITIHEFLVRDIFGYFEKGRFIRKKVRHTRKAIKGALRFARRKKSYPSKKTTEALNALEQIHDEIEYTYKAIKTAFEEAEAAIKMIRQEKIGDITPLVKSARAHFKDHNLAAGMEHLKAAQERLKNIYLPKSRKAILGGLDSDIKQLKHELRHRQLSRS